MRSPSGSSPMAGIVRARAPVARITALDWSVRDLPSFSATTTLGAAPPFSRRAEPSTTSILCFRIRKATPDESCLATLRERSITAAKS